MQVYIQVKRTPKSLNQCDGTGVSGCFPVTGFFHSVCEDGAMLTIRREYAVEASEVHS
jgi:hypothetical protein